MSLQAVALQAEAIGTGKIMTQLNGEEHFAQERTEIWSRLTDADFLAKCLPGMERVESDDSAFLVCRIRPGFSFLKGTIKVTLDPYDRQPPDLLRIRVLSKGIGSFAIVEPAVELTADGAATRVSWNAESGELGGLLKPVSRSLIQAAARMVITDGWSGFKEALSQT